MMNDNRIGRAKTVNKFYLGCSLPLDEALEILKMPRRLAAVFLMEQPLDENSLMAKNSLSWPQS
jgi:hypothetical protein